MNTGTKGIQVFTTKFRHYWTECYELNLNYIRSYLLQESGYEIPNL